LAGPDTIISGVTERRTLEYSRRKTDRMVAGVAGGLADTLGVSDAYVRAAFITLTTIWGLGALLYLGFWLASFDRVEDRDVSRVATRKAIGLGLAFVGLMILLASLGWWPNTAVVVTAGALAFGTAALTDSARPSPLAALIDPSVDRPGRVRVVLGVILFIGGMAVFTNAVGPLFEVGIVFLAVALTGLGIAVAFGPWVRRLIADLGHERSERIRQEERAEVAAHLHDSVLQSLALIQRTDDPARMAILARHQEGELRDWLYGETPLDGIDMVSTALKNAANKVEKDHQIPIEVVTVGDQGVDEGGRALVGAATEAMVNAAKHSGADKLSLYFEAEEGEMIVYVTDQGNGFDPGAVGDDRKGIAKSIRARVEKAGGTVAISSEPGEGTEVVLTMPVESE
jgi:signal transduction histidine kinase